MIPSYELDLEDPNELDPGLVSLITSYICKNILNLREENVLIKDFNFEIEYFFSFDLVMSEQFFGGSKLLYDIHERGNYLFEEKSTKIKKDPDDIFDSFNEVKQLMLTLNAKGVVLPDLNKKRFPYDIVKRIFQSKYSKSVSYTGANEKKYTKSCVPKLSNIEIFDVINRVKLRTIVNFSVAGFSDIFSYKIDGIDLSEGSIYDDNGDLYVISCEYCNFIEITHNCDICLHDLCSQCRIDIPLKFKHIYICRRPECVTNHNQIVRDGVEQENTDLFFKFEGMNLRLDDLKNNFNIFFIIPDIFIFILTKQFSDYIRVLILDKYSIQLAGWVYFVALVIEFSILLALVHKGLIPMILKFYQHKYFKFLLKLTPRELLARYLIGDYEEMSAKGK